MGNKGTWISKNEKKKKKKKKKLFEDNRLNPLQIQIAIVNFFFYCK